MDALLDHRGWWVAGPTGYVGPNAAPPSGAGAHRVALVEVRVETLVAPPAQLDAEVESAFGPGTVVVVQDLGQYRNQCFAAEETELERTEAWENTSLMAPYPLAVQAWREAEGRTGAEDTQAVVERLGETLLITVCQGPRILAYRQADSDPGGRTHEIRRTLLALGAEAGQTVVLVAPDLLPLDLHEPQQLRLGGEVSAPVRVLPSPCVALVGLGTLRPRAGFVSRAAARALAEARERARQRRRALITMAAGALGGLVWVGGLIAEHEAGTTRRRLLAAEAELQQALERLAPRKLEPLLRPRPLREVGDLLAALPPGAGLVDAVAEPEGAQTRLTLRFRPSDPGFHTPQVIAATLRAFRELSQVEVRPTLERDGELIWEAQARIREAGS